jgi:hypothetical protein
MNENKGNDDASFEQRLKSARTRQGLDTPSPSESTGGGIPSTAMGLACA